MAETRPIPNVSTGVPVYNGERYLGETLEALLAQTYPDFEIVICDNASTDGTREIAESFAARDDRIRYVRNEENIGGANNFRRCLELARGEYFRWQSADDLLAPTLVERCLEVLEERPDVVQAYTRTIFIDEEGREFRRYDDNLHAPEESPRVRYLKVMRNLGYVNAVYGLMRADMLRKTLVHGSFVGADLLVQAEIALYGKIWEVPEYLFLRRMHPEAHSSLSDEDKWSFYRPEEEATFRFYRWRHLAERLKAVARSPASLTEKVRLSGSLLRVAVADRDLLLAELGRAGRAALGRGS